jgi:hypothetical protein
MKMSNVKPADTNTALPAVIIPTAYLRQAPASPLVYVNSTPTYGLAFIVPAYTGMSLDDEVSLKWRGFRGEFTRVLPPDAADQAVHLFVPKAIIDLNATDDGTPEVQVEYIVKQKNGSEQHSPVTRLGVYFYGSDIPVPPPPEVEGAVKDEYSGIGYFLDLGKIGSELRVNFPPAPSGPYTFGRWLNYGKKGNLLSDETFEVFEGHIDVQKERLDELEAGGRVWIESIDTSQQHSIATLLKLI